MKKVWMLEKGDLEAIEQFTMIKLALRAIRTVKEKGKRCERVDEPKEASRFPSKT